jgi:anti-sigma B factor antagonist
MTAEMPAFGLDERTEGDRVHLVPQGELDLASAPLLEERTHGALRNASAPVVLDLRELTFMDSTGVRAIVSAHQVAKEAGVELVVVRPGADSAARRVIEISGIDGALGLVDAP